MSPSYRRSCQQAKWNSFGPGEPTCFRRCASNVREGYWMVWNAQHKDIWCFLLYRTSCKWGKLQKEFFCTMLYRRGYTGWISAFPRKWSFSTLGNRCAKVFGYENSAALDCEGRSHRIANKATRLHFSRFLMWGYVKNYVFPVQVRSPSHNKERIEQVTKTEGSKTLKMRGII